MEVIDYLKKQENRLERIEKLLSLQKTILNIDEVSVLTGLSKSTIYKMTSKREIPHYKKSKHLVFDKVECENWIKSNKVTSQDEIDQEATSYVTLNKEGGKK